MIITIYLDEKSSEELSLLRSIAESVPGGRLNISSLVQELIHNLVVQQTGVSS